MLAYLDSMRGFGMVRVRLAIAMIAASMFVAGSTGASHLPIGPNHSASMRRRPHLHAASRSLVPSRSTHQPSVCRFSPWKNRIKSVLEQTNTNLIEERDLGPAILPARGFVLGILSLGDCSIPAHRPMRC
jgi:hypothetical protein